jgi:hypothetical protein
VDSPTSVPDVSRQVAPARGSFLACASCWQRITTASAAVSVAGAHVHTLTNPYGVRFRVGCFASVVGCSLIGEPSTYWTWFPGYAWQIENCGDCRVHLGWAYRSASHSFHGLILERLREAQED